MKEQEASVNSITEQKAKIRLRYQGIDPNLLVVLPAKTETGLYDDTVHRRVAVYARVSTDDPHQTSSYELQKNYYEGYVSRHPNWELVGIYADEGISGTSLHHRDAFKRMIDDCTNGKIDLIITKSVSRFSRNIVDCVGTVTALKSQTPPIGVFFENEQIFTLDSTSEMSLSFISAMAQEESHTKSTSMNASYEMRFSHGIFLTPPLLGYDQDENGKLIINEEEAKTVRLIFFTYLYGYSTSQIAELLTALGRPTKKGNTVWSSNSVLGVLQNERHCGEVLARKTYTPNYLDHRTRKNRGERNQYRYKEDHEAIISPTDFVAVQRKISNAKYGGSGIPELHVIPSGALKGFVTVNPRWASFSSSDYVAASAEISSLTQTDENEISIQAQTGDPDFRGFEIARTQFFGTAQKVRVTFSMDNITFSSDALKKLNNPEYVEFLVHPQKKFFAVRKCDRNCRTAVKWASSASGKPMPKPISCAAYIETIFALFHWDPKYRYRASGVRRQRVEESVLIFDLNETEILIPAEFLDEFRQQNDVSNLEFSPLHLPGRKQTILAYPQSWADSFGSEYYKHTQASETSAIDRDGQWDIAADGTIYAGTEPQPSPREQLAQHITQLISSFKEEEDV